MTHNIVVGADDSATATTWPPGAAEITIGSRGGVRELLKSQVGDRCWTPIAWAPGTECSSDVSGDVSHNPESGTQYE